MKLAGLLEFEDGAIVSHPEVDQLGIRILADDAGVVTRSDLIGCLSNRARHKDDFLVITGHSSCKCCVAGYRRCGTTRTSGCASVEACVTCSCLSYH